MADSPFDAIRDYGDRVEERLRGARFRFERDAAIGGLRVDFLVRGASDDSYVVLDLKFLVTDMTQFAMRALHLATRVREASKARRVFIVTLAPVPNATAFDSPALRVVAEADLVDALATEFGATSQVRGFAVDAFIARGQVFAAMPFSEEFDDVFFVAIAGAAEQLHLQSYRVDYDEYAGDVVARIRSEIRRSLIVVADLTRQRPNVLYEMGFAQALKDPLVQVVPICADPLRDVPFDVSHENILGYRLGQTTKLRDGLVRRLGALLAPVG